MTEKQLWESTHVMRSTDKTSTRPCSAPAPSAVSLGLTGVRGRPLSSLYPNYFSNLCKETTSLLKTSGKDLSLVWVGLCTKPRSNPSSQGDVALSLANMSHKPLTGAEADCGRTTLLKAKLRDCSRRQAHYNLATATRSLGTMCTFL